MNETNLEQAAVAAAAFAERVQQHRFAEAEQLEKTIDDLVGHWTKDRVFRWPAAIAAIAGLNPRRKSYWPGPGWPKGKPRGSRPDSAAIASKAGQAASSRLTPDQRKARASHAGKHAPGWPKGKPRGPRKPKVVLEGA